MAQKLGNHRPLNLIDKEAKMASGHGEPEQLTGSSRAELNKFLTYNYWELLLCKS